MSIVVFDPVGFKLRYPELKDIDDATLQVFFNEGTLYLDNSDSSPVLDVTRRAVLLNMLTAHITALSGVVSGQIGGAPVGRLSRASQGSVYTSFDMSVSEKSSWFSQTQYGASYWKAIQPYLASPFRYVSWKGR